MILPARWGQFHLFMKLLTKLILKNEVQSFITEVTELYSDFLRVSTGENLFSNFPIKLIHASYVFIIFQIINKYCQRR